jgi:hypothetical protein
MRDAPLAGWQLVVVGVVLAGLLASVLRREGWRVHPLVALILAALAAPGALLGEGDAGPYVPALVFATAALGATLARTGSATGRATLWWLAGATFAVGDAVAPPLQLLDMMGEPGSSSHPALAAAALGATSSALALAGRREGRLPVALAWLLGIGALVGAVSAWLSWVPGVRVGQPSRLPALVALDGERVRLGVPLQAMVAFPNGAVVVVADGDALLEDVLLPGSVAVIAARLHAWPRTPGVLGLPLFYAQATVRLDDPRDPLAVARAGEAASRDGSDAVQVPRDAGWTVQDTVTACATLVRDHGVRCSVSAPASSPP